MHIAPFYFHNNLKTKNIFLEYFNILQDFTIKHYLNLGVHRDKLVMGIPTYGRTLVLYEPEKTEEDSLEDGLGMEENFAKSEGLLPYYEVRYYNAVYC